LVFKVKETEKGEAIVTKSTFLPKQVIAYPTLNYSVE
jgi:hypothetical protein